MKIRKLKEIIMSIAEINTSVSMEDIMEVASINSVIYDDIRMLKDKLSNVIIKHEEPAEEKKVLVIDNSYGYLKPPKELVDQYRKQPGGKPTKLTIEQAISCALYVKSIAPISDVEAVNKLYEYANTHLSECGLTRTNCSDFIKGHSFRRLTPDFFSYHSTTGQVYEVVDYNNK